MTFYKSVLLVEDNKHFAEMFEIFLKSLGFSEIIKAGDGLQAIEELKRRSFDLIVTDFNMPKMDGKQFVEVVLSSKFTFSKIVMLSGDLDNQVLLSELLSANRNIKFFPKYSDLEDVKIFIFND